MCNIPGPKKRIFVGKTKKQLKPLKDRNQKPTRRNTGAARLLGIESTVPSPALRVALTWKQRLCRPETVDVTAEVGG